MELLVEHSPPQVEEFINLRAAIGWGELEPILAQTALENSLYSVSIRSHGKLIAMARVVGDGALFFYLQDVIVAPAYQSKGIGQILMENVESYLSETAQQGATIGLFAAKGKEEFYLHYDFIKRTGEPLGLGMCKFV